MAGRGHFYFIDKMTDIDSKVLDCLQRESYEYMIISSLTFFNKQGDAISHVDSELEGAKAAKHEGLAHGTLFSFLTLVDPAKDPVDHVKV
jgi:hypothetical protein